MTINLHSKLSKVLIETKQIQIIGKSDDLEASKLQDKAFDAERIKLSYNGKFFLLPQV